MNFKDTQCCGITEITNLSSHGTDSRGAMVSFCQQQIGEPPRYHGSQVYYLGTLYSFYFFTAAVGPAYAKYGHAFAEFIEKNKLGKVWESPAIVNKAFHPDHANQVWIFMPDVDAVQAWWKDNAPKPPAPPKPAVKKPTFK